MANGDYQTNFFPEILKIFEDQGSDVRQKANLLDMLIGEGHQNYPLNVHQFKYEFNFDIREQFWKAMQCKAVQPVLYVERIHSCKVVEIYNGSADFLREYTLEETSSPVNEHVFIDRNNEVVLFLAEKEKIATVNRIISDGYKIYFLGSYFNNVAEMKESDFQEDMQKMFQKMLQSIREGKVEEFYNQYVSPLDSQQHSLR